MASNGVGATNLPSPLRRGTKTNRYTIVRGFIETPRRECFDIRTGLAAERVSETGMNLKNRMPKVAVELPKPEVRSATSFRNRPLSQILTDLSIFIPADGAC